MKQESNRRRFLAQTFFSGVTVAMARSSVNVLAQQSENGAPESPRCRILPLAGHQTSLQIGDAERVRWHFGTEYPRPFFFPFRGLSGESLTRMGHPGAPNHDHHRSIWFAHHDVNGNDFWSDNTTARIRQKQWLCYDDGADACKMAVLLGWFGGEEGRELMEQTLVAILRPSPDGETFLELQSEFRPAGDVIQLGNTNFGFLAVRVAKSISEFFGGGILTDSEGRQGEPAIFGKRAKWMDYSGPVPGGGIEGITYFDHHDNPRYPTHWHVREDGWMGASFCFEEGLEIRKDQPLRLRYLLHAHNGPADATRGGETAKQFASWPSYSVVPSRKKHQQFELVESL